MLPGSVILESVSSYHFVKQLACNCPYVFSRLMLFNSPQDCCILYEISVEGNMKPYAANNNDRSFISCFRLLGNYNYHI